MSETVFAADPTRLLIAALVRASVGAAGGAVTVQSTGIHAGGCRTFAIIPCSDGLCDYRWCNGIQSCE